MSETRDEHGPLLDNTMVLYGSACSSTHNARNYPLVLAGGENMGLKHGGYHVFEEKGNPDVEFVRQHAQRRWRSDGQFL